MPILTPALSFSAKLTNSVDTAILLLDTGLKLSSAAKDLDKQSGGFLTHHIEQQSAFKGEVGQFLTLPLPPKSAYTRVILVGISEPKKPKPDQYETAGGKLVSVLAAAQSAKAAILNADALKKDSLLSLILGVRLGSYSFDTYKTKKDDSKKYAGLKSLVIVSEDAKGLAKESLESEALSESISLTRDLVNMPPNKLYPESFAELIKKNLTPLGVKVQVLDDKTISKLGMGCLMAVGQASEHLPRLVIMSWPGTSTAKSKKQKPVALVGKGITFDSGGLNVKPFEGMMDMKMDMGGAATVVGLMSMLAKRKCKSPVVGVVALAENAISDEATRPSDIVTSYSGKTVEILNTDAEGRLVLADALTYVQEKFDPKLVIDLATLTGAIMIALGLNYCGTFVNDDTVWTQLNKASATTGEKLWRMPLDDNFRREMDSPFADIKNIGNGRFGGSCTAAAFLSEFIDEGRAWAHLDIAGVAMSKTTPTCPVPFASGFGVKILNNFIKEFYE